MYILNTTFVVDHPHHDRWLRTIKDHYVPLLKESGFQKLVFTKVLTNDPEGHFTYSLQIEVPDMEAYEKLTKELLPDYTAIADQLFNGQVLYFTTLMKKTDLE